MAEADEEPLALSAETFAALQDFYKEQEDRERVLASLSSGAPADKENAIKSMSEFTENWQLSQFWYSEATAEALAQEAIKATPDGGSIACISAPTLYLAIQKALAKDPKVTRTVQLFEFDQRFRVFGSEFVLYDYSHPLEVPRDLREKFDLVFADPPFLSEECMTKVAVTIKYLTKAKIMVCTGAIMEDLLKRLFNLELCDFKPQHTNNLANEFRCFANYSTNLPSSS